MATSTTRLGLRKPNNTTDTVNVVTDLNDNWDKLDAAVGAIVCTSTTRPGSPYTGELIFETDTKKVACWDGTAWGYKSAEHTIVTASIDKVNFGTLELAGGKTTGTTNASGDFNLTAAICSALGWTNVKQLVVWNGDGAARSNISMGLMTDIPSGSNNIRTWVGSTGAAVASLSCTWRWLAMGI